MRKRTRTAQGKVENADVNFIHIGQTSRQEVLEKFKAYDTGFQSNRFFLGRASSSKWGGWIVVGGGYSGAGTAGRLWHTWNLLVEFDDKGIVKNSEVFPDKFLIAKLGPVAAAEKPLDSSQRNELSVWRGGRVVDAKIISVESAKVVQAKIILYHGCLEFEEAGAGKKKDLDFTMDRAKIKSIAPGRIMESTLDISYTAVTIHFTEKPKPESRIRGNAIRVSMRLPDLVVLLNFLTPRERSGQFSAVAI